MACIGSRRPYSFSHRTDLEEKDMTVLKQAAIAAVTITAALTLTASACDSSLARGARRVGGEVAKEVAPPAVDRLREGIEDQYEDRYRPPRRPGG